jgi:hypothetical protein
MASRSWPFSIGCVGARPGTRGVDGGALPVGRAASRLATATRAGSPHASTHRPWLSAATERLQRCKYEEGKDLGKPCAEGAAVVPCRPRAPASRPGHSASVRAGRYFIYRPGWTDFEPYDGICADEIGLAGWRRSVCLGRAE